MKGNFTNHSSSENHSNHSLDGLPRFQDYPKFDNWFKVVNSCQ